MMAIVYYDGDCGVCNSFVRRTIRHDAEGRFRFAPLGGATAKEHGVSVMDRVVVTQVAAADGTPLEEPKTLDRARAVLFLLKHSDSAGQRRLGASVAWLPTFLLDLGYRAFG
ncbi:MAG: thiol-disulfide oxidoreductase DCC family protein, partial [Planctomycetota bacterium]